MTSDQHNTPANSAQPKGAPIWRRFAAMIYDGFVLLALSFAYGAVMTTIAAQQNAAPTNMDSHQPMFDNPLFGLGWLATIMGFYIIFWRRFGQTIGMKTWHLKVVSAKPENTTLQRLPWLECFLRSISSLMGFGLFGFSYIVGAISPTGDCWHDKISGTRVLVIKPPKKKR